MAALAGLPSHNLFFIRGEHHLKAPTYVQLTVLAFAILSLLQANGGFWQAMLSSLSILGSFSGSLFTSMIIYRLVFHPLRSFPGPIMFWLSKLWHVLRVAPSMQNHIVLESLHKRYGDFVRTGTLYLSPLAFKLISDSKIGPSELTIFNPGVFDVIGGAGTKCVKAPWYDMLYPLIAINSIRDRNGYAPRRKMWDAALNTKG